MITLQEARTTRKYKIASSVSKIIKTLSKRKNGANRHHIKELINDGVNKLLSTNKSYTTLSKEKITIYDKEVTVFLQLIKDITNAIYGQFEPLSKTIFIFISLKDEKSFLNFLSSEQFLYKLKITLTHELTHLFDNFEQKEDHYSNIGTD